MHPIEVQAQQGFDLLALEVVLAHLDCSVHHFRRPSNSK
jgi:hypothetical protein